MMKICVFGLWHLGSVTAACVAEHFPTIGLDPDEATVARLRSGEPPIAEPGLAELIRKGISAKQLTFTCDPREAVAECDVIWVTFDTPVNEDDEADVEYVERQIASVFPYLREHSVVLISSQMPAGSTARIEAEYRSKFPGRDVGFAYSPENLRLGKALDVFRQSGRIVAGVRRPEDQAVLEPLLTRFCGNVMWVSVESAEMTKHALNAFLATSVTFINEIAALCEEVGADAKEVERGLKSEERIGPKAYLGPGGPFAGGTLARDVAFLTKIGSRVRIPTPLLASIRTSNDLHKNWVRRRLEAALGSLAEKTVAVLGLTYKPGTNTLRRSSAVELCVWLAGQGARVRAYDPAVRELPANLGAEIRLCGTAAEAARGADAMVVATEWPEFRQMAVAELVAAMARKVVVDANRFLEKSLSAIPEVEYITVGKPKGAA
jgi:UDPglucose 6-dehydrogenase